MKKDRKAESRNQKAETGERGNRDGRVLVTRPGLARALAVSVRTVDRMLAAEEIQPIRLGAAVRFHVPDVIESLKDGNRKWGRAAAAFGGSSKSESRNPKEGGEGSAAETENRRIGETAQRTERSPGA